MDDVSFTMLFDSYMINNELEGLNHVLFLPHADNRFTSAVTLSKVTHTTKRAFNNKTNRQEDLFDISLLQNEPSINIHLQWQNHSYFEYFALKVPAILQFYCRYYDGRIKKCEVDNGGCCEEP